MNALDLWLGCLLAMAYAVGAVGLQRLFRRFIDPYRQRTRSPAEAA